MKVTGHPQAGLLHGRGLWGMGGRPLHSRSQVPALRKQGVLSLGGASLSGSRCGVTQEREREIGRGFQDCRFRTGNQGGTASGGRTKASRPGWGRSRCSSKGRRLGGAWCRVPCKARPHPGAGRTFPLPLNSGAWRIPRPDLSPLCEVAAPAPPPRHPGPPGGPESPRGEASASAAPPAGPFARVLRAVGRGDAGGPPGFPEGQVRPPPAHCPLFASPARFPRPCAAPAL